MWNIMLVLIICTLLIGFLKSEDLFMKRDNSLFPPYTQSNWDYRGNTVLTGSKVILTIDRHSQRGLIWNTQPLKCPNWEIHLQFRVHGSTGQLYADGMALWYVSRFPKPGSVFGSAEKFRGLGIFLDTYTNSPNKHPFTDYPYINAMINNGSRSYDIESDGKSTQLGGCSCSFRNKDHDTYLRVRYENRKLTIFYDIDNRQEWTKCFEMSGVQLPTGYYLAVSAATGDLTDNHELMSLKTYEIPSKEEVNSEDLSNIEPSGPMEDVQKVNVQEENKSDHPQSSVTIWKLILVLLSLGGITVGVCIFYYMARQDRRKRFY